MASESALTPSGNTPVLFHSSDRLRIDLEFATAFAMTTAEFPRNWLPLRSTDVRLLFVEMCLAIASHCVSSKQLSN